MEIELTDEQLEACAIAARESYHKHALVSWKDCEYKDDWRECVRAVLATLPAQPKRVSHCNFGTDCPFCRKSLDEAPALSMSGEEETGMKKFWQVFHHLVAHPLIGLSFGRLWAWKLHDWTLPKAWPGEPKDIAQRWAGLE